MSLLLNMLNIKQMTTKLQQTYQPARVKAISKIVCLHPAFVCKAVIELETITIKRCYAMVNRLPSHGLEGHTWLQALYISLSCRKPRDGLLVGNTKTLKTCMGNGPGIVPILHRVGWESSPALLTHKAISTTCRSLVQSSVNFRTIVQVMHNDHDGTSGLSKSSP